ncbi:hypothetical protein TeGR_g1575, partial [Tetraparma gracilis]
MFLPLLLLCLLCLLPSSLPAPLGAARRGVRQSSPNHAHDRSALSLSPAGSLLQHDYAALHLRGYYRDHMALLYPDATAPPAFLTYAVLPGVGVLLLTPSLLNFHPLSPPPALPLLSRPSSTPSSLSLLYLLSPPHTLSLLSPALPPPPSPSSPSPLLRLADSLLAPHHLKNAGRALPLAGLGVAAGPAGVELSHCTGGGGVSRALVPDGSDSGAPAEGGRLPGDGGWEGLGEAMLEGVSMRSFILYTSSTLSNQGAAFARLLKQLPALLSSSLSSPPSPASLLSLLSSYRAWWLTLYRTDPLRLLIETGLILFILLVLLLTRT